MLLLIHTEGLTGGCHPPTSSSRWAGHSFIILYSHVRNQPPSVCGNKQLAINEAPLFVDRRLGVVWGGVFTREGKSYLNIMSLHSYSDKLVFLKF